MIRLVAIDIDGTLLNDNLELSQENKETIRKVRSLGIPVVLCSARGPLSCFPIAKEFDGTDPIVTHNGAVVIDPQRNISFLSTLTESDLTKAVMRCRELDIHYDINDIFDVYVERTIDAKVAEIYKGFFLDPIEVPDLLVVPGLSPVQVILIGEFKEISDAYGQLLSLQSDSISVQRTGEEFLAIRGGETNKMTGIKALAQQWGITPGQVLAIGNYYNDLPLLDWAGTAVAVANSPQEVQEAADVVVASNNDHGVSEALRRFVLGAG